MTTAEKAARMDAHKKSPTHLANETGKPYCTPDTAATKFKTTDDKAKVTCKRCLAKMGIAKTEEDAEKKAISSLEKVAAAKEAEERKEAAAKKEEERRRKLEEAESMEDIEDEDEDGNEEQEDEEVEDVEDEEGKTRLIFRKISEYEKPGIKTEGGTEIIDNGDPVAKYLRGKTMNELYNVAWTVATTDTGGVLTLGSGKRKVIINSKDDLRAKYGRLNPGMQRMNLGNIVRRGLKAFTIGEDGVEGLLNQLTDEGGE